MNSVKNNSKKKRMRELGKKKVCGYFVVMHLKFEQFLHNCSLSYLEKAQEEG